MILRICSDATGTHLASHVTHKSGSHSLPVKRQGQYSDSHALAVALALDLDFELCFGGLHLHPFHLILPIRNPNGVIH